MEPTFGLELSTAAAAGADPAAEALAAESLGFDLLTITDHLHGSHPTFETWTLLAWVAASTRHVKLAPLVLALPYRSPAVLAKMAETLARLSHGRLVLGLGGGGFDAEFSAFGLPVREPAEKVEALGEALEILHGMWTVSPFTYAGRHFDVHEARTEPKPVTHIPVWLGTYGRRGLALTGRLADGWNLSMPFAPPERAVELRDRVRRAAEAAGRDPGELTYAYNVPVLVREGAEPTPKVLAGAPREVAARLADFVRLGFGTLCLSIAGGREAGEQRERLALEVLPAVRDALA